MITRAVSIPIALCLASGALFAGCSGGGSGSGSGATSSGSAPNAPTGLDAIASANRIDLEWLDNSNNEQGFRVERSLAGAGSFEILVSLPVGSLTHSDVKVAAGVSYDYRIVAYNAAGETPSALVRITASADTGSSGGSTGSSGSSGGSTGGGSGATVSVQIDLTVGLGGAGFSGDAGLAVSAALNGVEGVVTDLLGNTYLADTLNNRIRKIDSATGVITTIGGTGAASFSGDGGLATAATFNGPSDVAVDALGNVYVADEGNNRIRKIDLQGNVSTVAGTGVAGFSGDGGVATSAQLNTPTALDLDAAGNLFLIDSVNERLRRVDVQTGVMTTIAGNGTTGFAGDGGAATSAALSGPADLAIDTSGRVFVADSGNNRVRRIDTAGTITTVAGTGTAGFSGEGGAAVSADFNAPAGVAVDALGNLYIADRANNRIRKVAAGTGITTSVAGTGVAGSTGDGGLATSAQLNSPEKLSLDTSGRLLLADRANHKVRRLSRLADLAIETTSLSPVPLGRPVRLSLRAGGGTGAGLTWALAAGTLPAGLTLTGNGASATLTGTVNAGATTSLTFRVTDSAGTQVTRVINLVVGAGRIATTAGDGIGGFAGDGAAATGANLSAGVSGVALAANGDLYLADTANNRIRRITKSTGVIATVAGNGVATFGGDGGAATAASLNAPRGVSLDAAGNLFIADTGNNRIRRVDASSQVMTTVAGAGGAGFSGDGGLATAANLSGPRSIAISASGDLYIADTNNLRVRRVRALTGRITSVAGTGLLGLLSALGDGGLATLSVLNRPTDLTLDASGNLFVVDQLSFRVRRVDGQTGVISTVAGSGLLAGFTGDGGLATLARLSSPSSIAVDAAGNLFVSDTGNHRIRMVTSAGVISTLSGTGTASFGGDGGLAASALLDTPIGMAAGQGAVHLVDQDNLRLRTVVAQ